MVRLTLLLFVTLTLFGCIEAGTLEVDQETDVPVIDTTDPQTSNPPTTDNPTTSNPTDPVDDTNPPGDDPTTADPDTEPMCTETQALCDGACIDVAADDANCGGCGVMCGSGTICMAQECVCEVGDLCEGECVDTTSSFQHCGTCGNSCAGGQACVDGGCMNVGEVEGVLIATNQARMAGADCGVYGQFAPTDPIEGDPQLHEAAQVHADDMSQNDFFSHTGSDGSNFAQRIGRTGYSGQPIGENIAAGQNSPESVVQGWIDSDGHCRNLMNPSATKIGIGYQTGGPYGTLWVQVFAR